MSYFCLYSFFLVLPVCGFSEDGIRAFGIFAQDPEVAGQRPGGVDGLPVAEPVVERHVDVEPVLPFAADDRQGLDLREVDFVERKDGQDFREASLRVAEREDQRRLVGVRRVGKLPGPGVVGQQQEAREVVLVGFDAALEDFEPVHLGSLGSADRRGARQAFFGNLPGAVGGVGPLDDLQPGPRLEKLPALHQGDGVRVHFADLVERLPGQRGDDVRDAQLLLSHDAGVALLEQFVVGQQAPGDGVLDGGDAQQAAVLRHAVEEFVEAHAGNGFDLAVGEISACGGFVVASGDALDGDSFHSGWVFEKKSRSSRAGFSCHILYYFNFIQSIPCDPARSFAVKEKVKKEVCETVSSHAKGILSYCLEQK